MRSHPSSDARKNTASRWFHWYCSRLLRPFETSPFEDWLAAMLVVGGWALLAAASWLLGSSGLGFDRQPDLGGYEWLIVGLLLLAAALSGLWAIRRVVEQGGKAVFLWLRVRRIPDDGQGNTAGNRPDDMPFVVLIFGSTFGGVAMSNLWAAGHYFDTSPIPWLIAGVWFAGGVAWTSWVHRRVMACPASTHVVECIRDGHAKAAASIAGLFAVLSTWTAGVAGIPTTIPATSDGNALLAFIAIVLAAVCIQLSVSRTKHLAKSQAVAVTESPA